MESWTPNAPGPYVSIWKRAGNVGPKPRSCRGDDSGLHAFSQKARITPAIPRPPRYWHGFEGMLSRAESESAATLGWKNRFEALYRLMPRAVWLGGAVAASAMALIVFLEVTSSRSNIASVAEILHRAVQE